MAHPISKDFQIGSQVWPGLGKLVEEMGELQQVLGKLIATGGKPEHWDGTDLRKRLVEEMGDVLGAMHFLMRHNLTRKEARFVVNERAREKCSLFQLWHDSDEDPILGVEGDHPDITDWEGEDAYNAACHVCGWRKGGANLGAVAVPGSAHEVAHPSHRVNYTQRTSVRLPLPIPDTTGWDDHPPIEEPEASTEAPSALPVDFPPAPDPTTADGLFHRLWTKAVGTPGYDKKQWLTLQRTLGVGVLCDTPIKPHWSDAPTGPTEQSPAPVGAPPRVHPTIQAALKRKATDGSPSKVCTAYCDFCGWSAAGATLEEVGALGDAHIQANLGGHQVNYIYPKRKATRPALSLRLSKKVLSFLDEYGGYSPARNKAWVIDKVVRMLTGDDYDQWVADHCNGEDGPNTYVWDTGGAP